eukprot:gene14741-14910_t
MAANKSSAASSKLLLIFGLALLAMTTTAAASRTLTQKPDDSAGDKDDGNLTLDEAKMVEAWNLHYKLWKPSKKAAKEAVKVVLLDEDGNAVED